jgi:hypothetical protein
MFMLSQTRNAAMQDPKIGNEEIGHEEAAMQDHLFAY